MNVSFLEHFQGNFLQGEKQIEENFWEVTPTLLAKTIDSPENLQKLVVPTL